MIEFDEHDNRMVLKLVYYGPALSGKTTNLMRLHDLLDKSGRGDLMVLDTVDDRTLFFDLLPFFMVAPSGLKIKLKVYTVPGQVKHDATRKAVLQRADAVAFIADSQISQASNNAESFENLEKNLALVGLDIETIPLIIQYNKRDLPDIVTEEEVHRVWSPTHIPVCMACALQGVGVVESYQTLLNLVFTALDQRHGLTDRHGLDRASFLQQLTCRAKGAGS